MKASLIVLLNERKRSPNDKNLAKTHNLFEIGYKCACESGTAFSLRSLLECRICIPQKRAESPIRI